jgi:hypothetical protein
MTVDDRSLYLDALSAAKKRVERDGRIITHCKWDGAVLEVETSIPAPDVPEGSLL